MKLLISPHHVWLICSMSLAHMRRLLWIHDDVNRNGKWKPVQHLCDLLLWNTVLVPPKGKTSVWTLLDSTKREPERFPKRNQNIAPWWRAHYPFLKDSETKPSKCASLIFQFFISSWSSIHFLIKAIFHTTDRGKNVMTGDVLFVNWCCRLAH